MRVFYYRAFEPNIDGAGGVKRSHQITELLKKRYKNIKILKLEKFKRINRIKKILFYFKINKYINKLNVPNLSIKQKYKISCNILSVKTRIPKIKTGDILIYEHSQVLSWFVPFVFYQLKCKVLVFPHNLESFVPQKLVSRFLTRQQNQALELAVLRFAEKVFVISKEENWFLRLQNCNSFYFPFIVDKKQSFELEKLKEKRLNRKNNNQFLILGSFYPPTKDGIIELVSYLQQNFNEDYVFHIAGYGTEQLKAEIKQSGNVFLHGTVSKEKLYELYETVDACILNQPPTTGALTKIPELLFAGIPIISDVNASRNFFKYENLYTFWDIKDLGRLIRSVGIGEKNDEEDEIIFSIVKKEMIKVFL